MNIHQQFIIDALKQDFPSTERFLKFKKSFYSKNKLPQPTNADIRELYEKMVAQKKIKRKSDLEKAMLSRSVRTQSGVAIVAVLTKPYACPGKCAFCPTEDNMPKSYLANEPAVMRAIMNKFNPYQQVQSRLHALMINGHSTNKIELIVMGGTFSYFPKKYQYWFIKECFRACNEFTISQKSSHFAKATRDKNVKSLPRRMTWGQKSINLNLSTLKQQLLYEQKRNEKTKTRIVGLTLETRPDWIDEKEIVNFRKLGCTRVELGVQSIYDEILKKNYRGHLTQATIQATRLLKNAGFKINYHMMPGLYGSLPFGKITDEGRSSKKSEITSDERGGTLGNNFSDFQMFKELFTNQNYQPDMLKIYPTVVIKGTLLYRWWEQGKYKPLSNENFEKLIIKIKNEIIPPYVRIQRLVRDVPLSSIEAGPTVSNLRQIINPKVNCQCIRCREIKGDYSFSQKSKVKSRKSLNRIDYLASDGKEIFLQFIDENNRLYALLRLRINPINKLPKLINNNSSFIIYTAIIREVHTYGKLTAIGKKDKNSPQHIGLGRQLLQEAEKIAKEELTKLGIPKAKQKIAVISGVGVRDYYRKNGYRLQNTYMVKRLK